MPADLPGLLTGSHLVRVLRPALHDAHYLLPKKRDRAELRRHALKLRYWPNPNPMNESGLVLDVDWCWIRALKGEKIGELRINDTIGGMNNLRVIFYVAENPKPLPMIWVLAAFQKKSNDLTKANLATFEARKGIVLERFYND